MDDLVSQVTVDAGQACRIVILFLAMVQIHIFCLGSYGYWVISGKEGEEERGMALVPCAILPLPNQKDRCTTQVRTHKP